MARLRFPGRPGYRFDRLGVRYGAEEARNVTDPSLAVVASIHRGLMLFRELFGDSDEDEEFPGFTVKDVRLATKKLAAVPEMLSANKRKSMVSPPVRIETDHAAGTRMAQAKSCLESLPASERTRNRGKTVVRKSYKNMIDQGLAKPSKSHFVASIKELNRTLNAKEKKKQKLKKSVSPQMDSIAMDKKELTKLKNIKIRLKADGKGAKIVRCRGRPSKESALLQESDVYLMPHTGPQRPQKVLHLPFTKQTDKSRAKHLLAKAKKGQKSIAQNSDQEKHHRKTFILPTQSSRSSRVIKPNKRFLEEDNFSSVSPKKGRFNEPTGITSPLFVNVNDDDYDDASGMWSDIDSPALNDPSTSRGSLGFQSANTLADEQKTCLFEQPLIVSGKRQWKPSLKVRMKLGGEDTNDLPRKLENYKEGLVSPHGPVSPSFIPTSPFSEPRFGLFSQMGALGMSVKGAAASRMLPDREAEVEAKKRSGNNILRRAKLQLNRAALNRSKAALARKLKADMKKEAKMEARRQKQFGPLSPLGTVSSLHLLTTPPKPGFESPPLSPNSRPIGLQSPYRPDGPLSPQSSAKVSPSLSKSAKCVCAVCGNPNLMQRTGLYFGVPSCENCSKFYRAYMLRVQKEDILCANNGLCDISNTSRNKSICPVCRFQKCVSVFPKLPHARKRDGSKQSLSHAKLCQLLKKGSKDVLQAKIKAARDKERLKRERLEERERLKQELKQKRSEDRLHKAEKKKEEKRRKSDADQSHSDTSPLKSPGKSHTPHKKKSSLSPSKRSQGQDVIDDETRNNTSPSPVKSGRGPRIKHVCRKAAVVLGKPAATFPPASELRLSALPKKEKVKILREDELEKSAQGSDDELPMEQILLKAQERKEETGLLKKGPQKTKTRRVLKAPHGTKKRKQRCNECNGCLTKPCGECIYCLDRPKFGGNNKYKQACLSRRCINPRYTKEGTKAFIKPRSARRNQPPAKTKAVVKSVDSPDSAIPVTSSVSASTVTSVTPTTSQSTPSPTVSLYSAQTQPVLNRTGGEAYIHSTSVGEAYIPRGGDLNSKKLYLPPQVKFPEGKTGKEKAVTGSRLPTILPVLSPLAVNKALPQWSVRNSKEHRIKAEFREAYDVETAWSHGLALTTSGPICLRTVCFLCGSAGKHEMLFCCVCCEPFHSFCLEDDEQPSDENIENWCCKNCQYCNVCGRQDKLLRCDKCENTYHAECLGPNYPTKPSKKKNIWVCTKCVRCKSCGATTPGVGSNATWTYDFSLCYDCGKLMDRGNYCPICCKCYSDDDWEAKMVQCSLCESWVHAKCEGLSDERYELLSHMPDDVVFTCSCCAPQRPPLWEQALKEEMARGLSLVLASLWNSKCSQHLIKKLKADQESLVATDTPTPNPALTNTLGFQVSQLIENCVKKTSVTQATKDSIKNVEVGCDKNIDLSQVRDEMFAQYVGLIAKSGNIGLTDSCDVIELNSDQEEVKVQGETKSLIEPVPKSPVPERKIPVIQDTVPISTQLMADIVSASSLELISDTNSETTASDIPGALDISYQSVEESRCSQSLRENVDVLRSEKSQTPSILFSEIQGTGVMKASEPQTIPSKSAKTNSLSPEIGDNQSTSNETDNTPALTKELQSKGEKSVSHNNFLSVEVEDRLSQPMETGELSNPKSDTQNSIKFPSEQNMEIIHVQKNNEISISTESPMHTESTSEIENKQTGKLLEKRTNSVIVLPINSKCSGLTVSTELTHQTASQNTILNTNTQSLRTKVIVQEKSTVLPLVSQSMKPLGAGFSLHQLQGALLPHKRYPKDFESIKQKLYQEDYNSVEDFNEDMVMIIQSALSGLESQRSTARKKANNSVRSIYLKQMEKFFPWFSVQRCNLWEHNKNLPDGLLPNAVLPPYRDHEYAQWLHRPTTLRSPQPSPFKKIAKSTEHKVVPLVGMDEVDSPGLSQSVPDGEDSRQCLLCSVFGDGEPDEAGRLLFAGQDDWIHINCALWSAEVFEENDGSLQNVHDAWFRGKQLKCDVCFTRGATVGCCKGGCKANFHFMCARKDKCVFQEDKKVFCKTHIGHVDGVLIKENDFDVLRRVCIDMDDIRLPKKSWSKGLDPLTVNAIFGSCTVEFLGQLSYLSDRTTCLIPVSFTCTRMYWSTVDVRKRCLYTCRIIEVKPNNPLLSPEIVFKEMRIVHDQAHPDFLPVEKLDPCVQSYLEASSVEQKRKSQISLEVEPSEQTNMFTETMTPSDKFTNRSCAILPSIEDTVPVPPIPFLSSSFNGLASRTQTSQPMLSQSWPGSSRNNKTFIDYTLLSPTTLKHLNIDISKIPEPTLQKADTAEMSSKSTDFGDLTKVVSKLNQAAAYNSSRQKRASSVESVVASSVEKGSDDPIQEHNLPGSCHVSSNVSNVCDVESAREHSVKRNSDALSVIQLNSDSLSIGQNIPVSSVVVSSDAMVSDCEDECVITAIRTPDGTEITNLCSSRHAEVKLNPESDMTQPIIEQPEDVMYLELPPGVNIPSEENEEIQLMIVNEDELTNVDSPMEVEELTICPDENTSTQAADKNVSVTNELTNTISEVAHPQIENPLKESCNGKESVELSSPGRSDITVQQTDLNCVERTNNEMTKNKTLSSREHMEVKDTTSEKEVRKSIASNDVTNQQPLNKKADVRKETAVHLIHSSGPAEKETVKTITNSSTVRQSETVEIVPSGDGALVEKIVTNFRATSDTYLPVSCGEMESKMKTKHSTSDKIKVTDKIETTEALQPEVTDKIETTEALQPEVTDKIEKPEALQPEVTDKIETTEALQPEVTDKIETTEALQSEVTDKIETTEALQPEVTKIETTEALQPEVTDKIETTEALQPVHIVEETPLESTKLYNENVTSEKVQINVEKEIRMSVEKSSRKLNKCDKNIFEVLSSCKLDPESKHQENEKDIKRAESKRNIFDVLGYSDKVGSNDTTSNSKEKDRNVQAVCPSLKQKSFSTESISKLFHVDRQTYIVAPVAAKVVKRRHTVEKCEKDKKDNSSCSFSSNLVPVYNKKGNLIGQKLLVDSDPTRPKVNKSVSVEDITAVRNMNKTHSPKSNLISAANVESVSAHGNEVTLKEEDNSEKQSVKSEIKPEISVEDSDVLSIEENKDSKDTLSCDISGNDEKNISIRSRHFSANDCDKVMHIGEPQFLTESSIARAKALSKAKRLKTSQPLKTYPLRRTASRMCDEAMARAQLSKPSDESPTAQNMKLVNDELVESEENSSTCSEPPVLKTLGLRKVKGELGKFKHQRSESHPQKSLPLHDMIALKIKAHSLAKSAPGKEGPFKCPICKRSYRTKESFNTHVEDCDFEVSSEDDEDEDERNTTENKKIKVLDKTAVEVVVKRGRGRPPKRKISVNIDKDDVNTERSDTHSEDCDFEESCEDGKDKDEKNTTENKTLIVLNKMLVEDPVKRGRGRPPKRKISVTDAETDDVSTERADSPVFKKKPLEFQTLNLTPYRGRGRPRKSDILGKPCGRGRGIIRSLSLPEKKSLKLRTGSLLHGNNLGFSSKETSISSATTRLKDPSTKKRLPNSPLSEQKSHKRQASNSGSKRNPVLRKLRSRISLVQRVKTPYKEKRTRTLRFSNESTKEEGTDWSSEDDLKLCELTGNVLRKNKIVEQPGLREGDTVNQISPDMEKSCETNLNVSENKDSLSCTNSAVSENKDSLFGTNSIVSENKDSLSSPNSITKQNIETMSSNKMDSAKNIDQIPETSLNNIVISESPNEQLTDRSALNSLETPQNSKNKFIKTYSKNKVVELVDLTVLSDTEEESNSLSTSTVASSSVKTTVISGPKKMHSEQSYLKPSSSFYSSDAAAKTHYVKSTKKVIVYPSSTLLPQYAISSTFAVSEQSPADGQVASQLCSVPSQKIRESGKELINVNRKNSTPAIMKSSKLKQQYVRHHQNSADTQETNGERQAAIAPEKFDYQQPSASAAGRLNADSTNLHQSLTGTRVADTTTTMQTLPKPSQNKVQASPVELAIEKQINSILRNAPKGHSNVTIVHQPHGIGIEQFKEVMKQPPSIRPKGMNLNYLGSFVMNSDGQMPANQTGVQMSPSRTGVQMSKPINIHQAAPTYSLSARGITAPKQFTFTNPNPVATILSPVDASSLIQQVITNKMQPVNDQGLATVNHLIHPMTNPTQLSLCQTMPHIMSPAPFHQRLMTTGQILQPVSNISTQHSISNTLHQTMLNPLHQSIATPTQTQNVMYPSVKVSLPQILHNSLHQVSSHTAAVPHFPGGLTSNLVQTRYATQGPCTVQLQGIPVSNLVQPQQNMYFSNSTSILQNNSPVQPAGLAQGYSQPGQMLSKTIPSAKLVHSFPQPSQFVSKPINLQQGLTQSDPVMSKAVQSASIMSASRDGSHFFKTAAPLSFPAQTKTVSIGNANFTSTLPVSSASTSRENVAQQNIKPNLTNTSILKILMPSANTTTPFVSALSQNSAINILKEIADKGSTVRSSSSGSVVTVNANEHPKLRNMLHSIEETLDKATSKDKLITDLPLVGVSTSAGTKVSSSQLPIRVTSGKLSQLSPGTLRKMLQASPGTFHFSAPQSASLLRQQAFQNRTNSQMLVKKALKHKVVPKPSILCRKKLAQNMQIPGIQVKRINFESCLEKNGVKTYCRREIACQDNVNVKMSNPQLREPARNSGSQDNMNVKMPSPSFRKPPRNLAIQDNMSVKMPNPTVRAPPRHPARQAKPSAKKGCVTKTHSRPRGLHRPIATGRLPSHPMIHTQRDLCVLPQAALEEVVTESPLIAPLYGTEDPSQGEKRKSLRDKPHLMFEITSDDGYSVTAPTMEEAWRQVTEKVQDARDSGRLKQLSFSSVSGISMFGVNHPAVVYLTEQLYGARNCHRYKFQYFRHSRPKPNDEPAQNASGCIRCEPFVSRKPYDMFSFLMSHYRNKPYPEQQGPGDEEMALKSSRRPTSMSLPMAMRFRHLKEHSREAVGVYRSVIHGRGLFCKRNIDGGEMVIEYSGEVIRSILTDKREKYYESKGIGCYMFRIDDMEVIDATVHGSAARFINHSCDPNCYSKVINVDGKKHIVIFAMRPIKKGEELTYDYKFPIEEVKIPCSCGSKRCRKYLN